MTIFRDRALLSPVSGSTLHNLRFILFLVFLLPLLNIPALMAAKDDATRMIQNVPFFPQENHQCGPASLAAVMNFWGTKISPEKIAKDIYSDSAKGTLWIDLTLYARDHGFSAHQYYGSWGDLVTNIAEGFPLIVFVDQGVRPVQANHFRVVVGYGKDGIIVNSGKEKERFEPKGKFMKAWKKTQFWTLLIRPEKSLFEYKK